MIRPTLVTQTAATAARTTPMKIMSLTVENVYWFSQVFSLILLIGTVLLGGVALIAGKKLNDRQSAEMLTLATKLEEQREKAAKAETSLLELQERIKPRHLDRAKFVSFLKEYKSGPFDIQCAATDVEARNFAIEIQSAFWEAGWRQVRLGDQNIFFPQPIGLKLWIHSADEEAIPAHAGAVQQAFKHIKIPIATETREGQEKGTLILLVGSKP